MENENLANEGPFEREILIRMLLEAVSDAIVVADQTGKITFASAAAESLFGYPRGGMISCLIETLFPQGHRVDIRYQNQLISKHWAQVGTRFNIMVLRQNGDEFPISVVQRQIGPLTIYKITTNTSVFQTTFDLNMPGKQHQSLSQMLSVISHELRLSMAAIQISVGLVQESCERMHAASSDRHLGKLSNQVQAMAWMLDNVSLFSEHNASLAIVRPVCLNLTAFCTSLMEQAHAVYCQRCSFTCSQDSPIENVLVDQEILRRILLNLLSNAMKYSLQGGEVSLHVTCEGDDLVFRVSDQGIGIADEDRAQLFAPFFRGQNARDAKGVGLGLYVVKQCVDTYGGSITFVSVEGEGTTFTVRVPILTADTASLSNEISCA